MSLLRPLPELTASLTGIILLVSPLLEAGWDVWSKTIIHLISVAALLFILIHKYSEKKEFVLPLSISLLTFFALLSLSFFSSKIPFQSVIEMHNYLNYAIMILLAVNLYGENTDTLDKIVPYIAVSIIAMSLIGLYQKIFLHTQSVNSTMINANIFAGYLILSVPLFFKNIKNPLYAAAAILGLLSLILTRSVAAIGGLACAFFIVRLGLVRGGILSLLCGTILILSGFNINALSERFLWWKSALTLIYQHPFTGTGPGTFELVYPSVKAAGQASLYAHNYFLQFCSDLGIAAFLSAAIFIVRRVFSKAPSYVKMALIAVLIQNVFDFNLLILSNGILFWLLLGILCSSQVEPVRIKATPYFLIFTVLLLLYFTESFGNIYFSALKYNRASGLMSEGKLDQAKILYRESLSDRPDMWLANSNLAAIEIMNYKQSGEKSGLLEAAAELKKGIRNNPYFPDNRKMLLELNRTIAELK